MIEIIEKNVCMIRNGEEVITAHQANVREKIQDELEQILGFYPDLQENTEDGEYTVCLHTDSYDDLEEEQLEKLQKQNISEDDEETTKAIKKLLNCEFQIVGDYVRA